MSENERFYDDEIAPALLALAKRCHERGMSFLSAVEYAPGSVGRTSHYVEGYGHAMSNALAAIRAGDNADLFIGYIVSRAKEYGHSSAYLFQLGVPMHPPKVTLTPSTSEDRER